MHWQGLAEKLSAQLGEEIQIQSAESLSGGDICQAFKLYTNRGKLFLKTHSLSHYDLFQAEMFSLQKMAETLSIRVPQALASGTYDKQAWLLLEFIEMGPRGDDFQRGRDLALMHHHINHSVKPFGWPQDNFIGVSPQLNDWHSDWIAFYGQMRLKPQLQMALQRGISPKLADLGDRLIERLADWFDDYRPQASLLHGDLWGGNSAFNRDGEALIFDPASYYGDHETDLAMTELFGGFGPAFYAGYQEVYPLDKGYTQRKPLYQLYHILNHYNLFGGHYQQQAETLIHRLLRQSP